MKRAIAILMVSVGAALLLAACGGANDTANEGTAEDRADGAVPASQPTRVKIVHTEPGCHLFDVDGKRTKQATVQGPAIVTNQDIEPQVVGSKTVPVGGTITLPAGTYESRMPEQEEMDNILKLKVGSAARTQAVPERARPRAAKPMARRATVKMGEWYFKLDRKRLRAGKVTLVARNDGDIVHELLVVRTNRPPHRLPMHDGDPDLEQSDDIVVGAMHGHAGDTMDEHADEMSGSNRAAEAGHLARGESKSYRVRLRRGKYVLFCSIPGHYKAGQYTSLTVQ